MAQAQENEAVVAANTFTTNPHTMTPERSNGYYPERSIPAPLQDRDPSLVQRLLSLPSALLDRLRRGRVDNPLEKPATTTGEAISEVVIGEFLLPTEAEALAQYYADNLHFQSLQKPLQQFLFDLAEAPKLQAILLTVWDERGLPPNLSIYALTNLTQAYDEQYTNPSAPGHVRTAYKEFLRNINNGDVIGMADTSDLADIPIRTDLSFLNTGGQDIYSILPTLKQKIASEEFMGVKTATGTLRLVNIAMPQAVSVGVGG